jgi:hypothetical protein
MLSSLEGGVWVEGGVEAGPEAMRPRARNCWCSSPGRKLLEGRTCIVQLTPGTVGGNIIFHPNVCENKSILIYIVFIAKF